jgi:hypothetical protein
MRPGIRPLIALQLTDKICGGFLPSIENACGRVVWAGWRALRRRPRASPHVSQGVGCEA